MSGNSNNANNIILSRQSSVQKSNEGTTAEGQIHMISKPLQTVHTISIEEDDETHPLASQNRFSSQMLLKLASFKSSISSKLFLSGSSSSTTNDGNPNNNTSSRNNLPLAESTSQAETLIRRQRKGLLLSKQEKNKSSLLPHKTRSNSKVSSSELGSGGGTNDSNNKIREWNSSMWNQFISTTRNNFLKSTAVLQNNMGKINNLKSKMSSTEQLMQMPEKSVWKSLVAEFVGSLLLIAIGCGSNIYVNDPKPVNPTGVSLCWGLTVATLAQALGHVSGCHINPSVTLAMLITGKIPLVKAGLYIIVQCMGTTAGAFLLQALTPELVRGEFGITKLDPELTPIQGVGIEIMLTFMLVSVIFGVSDENRTDLKGSAPLAVGLCVAALVLCGGPLTGASLNPARSLGPSIVTGYWEHHWVFWVGPILGGLIAALMYQNVFRTLSSDEVEVIESESHMKRELNSKENGSNPPV